jgi:hypothetical protein
MTTLRLSTPSVPSWFPRAPDAGPGWRELAGAALLFGILAAAIFGWYVFDGGFIADDWVNSDHYYFHPDPGFWGAVDNYQTPSRPVAAVYVSLTYAIFGNHFDQHLVLSVVLAAFLSTAFFAFLRMLGLSAWLAFAAAALLLVFPSSDSTRWWTTGSQINLFIGMYLFAMVIAVAGRRRFGAAPSLPAVLTQLAASALAVAAVAGYEIVAPAVLLSFLLYWWAGRGERGGTAWRWLMDAIPTLLVLWFFTRKFGNSPSEGKQLLTNIRIVADGASWVLSYTLYPSRFVSSRWVALEGVVAVIAAVLLVRQVGARTPDREEIVRWLPRLLLALAAIVVGYLMIVPAADRYPIYAPGVQNRTNCFAALGFCALVVFLIGALVSMFTALLPRLSEKNRAELRAILTGLALVAVFAVYTVRIVENGQRWANAAEIQNQIVDEAQELVPAPPRDATIFTSPYAANYSPSLPIFGGGGNNDQLGAFKVTYGLDELRAFPLTEGMTEICGAKSMSTPDAGNSETEYGKAILVDFRTRQVHRPQNQAQCLRQTRAMEPFGPVNLTEDW